MTTRAGASLTRRSMLRAFGLGERPRVVEVGVLRGQYSKVLLDELNPLTLWLVDPWFAFPASEFEDYTTLRQADWDRMHDRVVSRFAGDARVSVIREASPGAARRFAPQSLDLVYLDGNHSYAAVSADIRAWRPKVRPGGALAGHDANLPEVMAALVGLPGVGFTGETGLFSWFWRVP